MAPTTVRTRGSQRNTCSHWLQWWFQCLQEGDRQSDGLVAVATPDCPIKGAEVVVLFDGDLVEQFTEFSGASYGIVTEQFGPIGGVPIPQRTFLAGGFEEIVSVLVDRLEHPVAA